LFTHFRAYYVAVLLPAGTLLLFVRGRRLVAAGVLVVGFWNLLLMAPLYVPSRNPDATSGEAADDAGTTKLRILVANVYTANRRHDIVNALIDYEDADLVLLMEVNGPWLAALEDSLNSYPHRVERPRDDNFGIALYSRVPWDAAEVVELGEAEVPSVIARFTIGGKKLAAIGTHTLPPMGAERSALRNDQLRAVAKYLRTVEGSRLVMGDLNMTSWSPHFRDLLSEAGLVDSRRGRGIQPTWTAFRGLVRLPLDHVLVSPDITVTDRRIGIPIGSDHLPVIVELAL
jgi:endonuclease/exonuclease/phosphatase (EEP) superfamily protein YafD